MPLQTRIVVAVVAAATLVGATLSLPALAGGGSGSVGGHALDVAGQNHLDHQAHRQEVMRVAEANGLTPAPAGSRCRSWLELHTTVGVQCSPGPMTADMFTADQLRPTAASGASAKAGGRATSDLTHTGLAKVDCIGSGSDGKRFQLMYARRSNHADHYVDTALEMKSWAEEIDQVLMASAHKTGGSRRARWVTDSLCAPKVLDVTVPTSVTTFSQLVSALQAQGYRSTSRKYLIAWDDQDQTAPFCGLGEVMPDSRKGSGNLNETQQYGAQFAAVEGVCKTAIPAAHELMHTLGAVQDDAPNASGHGHCTDESDIMCYVDGPGVVMRQVCPQEDEDLYDCHDDDYFNTHPLAGTYLATHWDPASSGWLDDTVFPVVPDLPQNVSAVAGAESVTVSWSPPLTDGGGAIEAYLVSVPTSTSTITKVVAGSARSATVTGLADGTAVRASVAAVNAAGAGTRNTAGSVTPTGSVTTYQVGPPSAPIAAPVAVAGPESATVRWLPASNGGTALAGYHVVASPGGAYVNTSDSVTSTTFPGLIGGTTYTFTVEAYSYKGLGPASAPSNAVKPTVVAKSYPFSTWASFVSRTYHDVVGRAPTATESSKAVSALTARTTTRAAFVQSLRRGAENVADVDPAARLYAAFLDRIPDAGGLDFWIARRRTGTWPLVRMADSFAASSEFKAKYGTLTNRQYVTRIYSDVLGRAPDAQGVTYWTKKLDTHASSRGAVMVGFSESSEYQRKQAPYTDVAVSFIQLIGRSPTESESESWWAQNVQGGTPYTTLLEDELSSDQYVVRVGG